MDVPVASPKVTDHGSVFGNTNQSAIHTSTRAKAPGADPNFEKTFPNFALYYSSPRAFAASGNLPAALRPGQENKPSPVPGYGAPSCRAANRGLVNRTTAILLFMRLEPSNTAVAALL